MNKIPKKIHYCWFSGDKKPLKIEKCFKSWKKFLPDYEIICWDSDSFDFDSVPIVRKLIEKKKWGTASDYVRLYALYNHGGIYLDSDVEILKDITPLLNSSFFIGSDWNVRLKNFYYLEAGIFGSVKGHQYLLKCMRHYEAINKPLDEESFAILESFDKIENRSLYDKNGNNRLVIAPIIMAEMMKSYGYENVNKLQQLEEDITVYPTPILVNHEHKPTKETYAIHWNTGTWINDQHRGFLYKICKKYDFMKFYNLLEKYKI